ncbi:MAG TPA: nitroreductase family protein [Xanthobacteraceae bacterium]
MQDATNSNLAARIEESLAERFGERLPVDPALAGLDELARIAGHRVHRDFLDRPVEPALLRLLCACALSAPSKSDLQQADILVVDDADQRRELIAFMPDMPWLDDAPVLLVFLANGARTPALARRRDKPFPNDHVDLLFNAAVDSAIVLTTFMRAAAAVGLGCCPLSAVRDHADRVSALLRLPERVIPVAGLAAGWRAEAGHITPRLGLETTLHQDRYRQGDLEQQIDAYDRRRAARHPYRRQRAVERWGQADFCGWSEDKARQYAQPLRTDFGAFLRAKGFRLD